MCLYSAASMLPRIASAMRQRSASYPTLAVEATPDDLALTPTRDVEMNQ